MYGTAKHLGVSRQTLYQFLAGDLNRLGRPKRLALAKYWNTTWRALNQEIRGQSRPKSPIPICHHCHTCTHFLSVCQPTKGETAS